MSPFRSIRTPAPRRSPGRAALSGLALLLAAACVSSRPEGPDPEQIADMHTELALRYYDLDDLARAEQQALKGLEVEPDNRPLRLMVGWIRLRYGTRDDILIAEGIFRQLLEEKDDDYRIWLGLADALERKGVLFREAGEDMASGQRDPTEPGRRNEEARNLLLRADENWRESISAYEETLSRKSEDLKAMNGLQRVYALLDSPEESLLWSSRVLEVSDRELDFWDQQLQRPDLTAGEEERLRALRQDAVELQVATHLSAATIQRRLGRLEDALASLDALLAREELADAYGMRAQLLRDLGRHEEAIQSIDEFLRLSEKEFDHPDIRRAYSLRSECEVARRGQTLGGIGR